MKQGRSIEDRGERVDDLDLDSLPSRFSRPDETTFELDEALEKAIDNLRPKERIVLHLRFGLGQRDSSLTLRDAGKVLGVTRERIRCIEAKALRKLRHPANLKLLEPVLASLT